MATRDFTDPQGVAWKVWTTEPSWGAHVLTPEYAHGWLTFESVSGERRRLVPIPDGWEALTPDGLRALWATAVLVRGTPASGIARLPDDPPRDDPTG